MRQIPGDCPGKTYTVLKVTVNPGVAKAKTGGPLTIKDRKLAVCQDRQSCDSAAGADVTVIVPVDANFVTVRASRTGPHLPRTGVHRLQDRPHICPGHDTGRAGGWIGPLTSMALGCMLFQRFVAGGKLAWEIKDEPAIKAVAVENITTKCTAIEESGAFRGWSCPGMWADSEYSYTPTLREYSEYACEYSDYPSGVSASRPTVHPSHTVYHHPPTCPSPPPPKPPPTPSQAVPAPEDDDKVDWGWPVPGKLIAGFSEATNKGIDIAGKQGDPVFASAGGRVVYSGQGLRGYGKLIIIKHNNTFLSAYAHNKEILVKEGQTVVKGQKIAEVGNTDADQTKLHFEIRRLGKPVDPAKFLPARPA